ncbi:hypothetical protein LXL04_035736 [Taraxacum kok-saghyz]
MFDDVAAAESSSASFSRSKQSLSTINHTTAVKSKGIWGEETNGRDRCVYGGKRQMEETDALIGELIGGAFFPSPMNLTHLLHEEFKNFHRETERKIRGRSDSSWTEPTNHAGERAAGSRKQSPVPKTADHAEETRV